MGKTEIKLCSHLTKFSYNIYCTFPSHRSHKCSTYSHVPNHPPLLLTLPFSCQSFSNSFNLSIEPQKSSEKSSWRERKSGKTMTRRNFSLKNVLMSVSRFRDRGMKEKYFKTRINPLIALSIVAQDANAVQSFSRLTFSIPKM